MTTTRQHFFKQLNRSIFLLAAVLISFSGYANDGISQEIRAIEALLANEKFEEARKFARDTSLSKPRFKEAEAFLSLVVGEPQHALDSLNARSQKECADLSNKSAELRIAADYVHVHCTVHWALKARAHFGLHQWSQSIQALEILEQVSKPTPLSSELILYALLRRISNLRSVKLETLLSDSMKKNPPDLIGQIVYVISNDQEVAELNLKNTYEFALAVSAANISANLIAKKVNGYSQGLESLRVNVPARLDGANMEIGLLRSLAKRSSAQK